MYLTAVAAFGAATLSFVFVFMTTSAFATTFVRMSFSLVFTLAFCFGAAPPTFLFCGGLVYERHVEVIHEKCKRLLFFIPRQQLAFAGIVVLHFPIGNPRWRLLVKLLESFCFGSKSRHYILTLEKLKSNL